MSKRIRGFKTDKLNSSVKDYARAMVMKENSLIHCNHKELFKSCKRINIAIFANTNEFDILIN